MSGCGLSFVHAIDVEGASAGLVLVRIVSGLEVVGVIR